MTMRMVTGRVKIPVRGLRGGRFIKSFSAGSTESAAQAIRRWQDSRKEFAPFPTEAACPTAKRSPSRGFPRCSMRADTSVFLDIAKDAASLLYCRNNGREVIISQRHRRGFLRDICAVIPIAIPMSAFLSAGASFTPSRSWRRYVYSFAKRIPRAVYVKAKRAHTLLFFPPLVQRLHRSMHPIPRR